MSRVMVVVARKFNGHEFWTTLDILQTRGHYFGVYSTDTLIADELDLTDQVQLPTENVVDRVGTMSGYDGIMIISGNMKDTEVYWTHPTVRKLVLEADSRNLAIAAICCSVPSIRYAAQGKKVSFFPLSRSKVLLRDAGAILMPTTMTRDQNLVTAEHQMATQYWAEEFCALLEGQPPLHIFSDTPYLHQVGRRERKPIPELERLKKRGGDR